MTRSAAITILRRLLGALWFASIVAIVFLAIATTIGPKVGLEIFAIRGSSMTPTIPLGAAVIASGVPAEAIGVGDVITIRADNGVIYTHRVVEIHPQPGERWLRTKGDANPTVDAALVPASAVVGVVHVIVPLVGYLIGMLSTPAGVVSFLAYAIALLGAIWVLEEAEDATENDRRSARSPDVVRA